MRGRAGAERQRGDYKERWRDEEGGRRAAYKGN